MKRTDSYLNISINNEEKDDKKISTINIDGIIGEDPYEAEEDQNTLKNVREKLKDIAAIEADEIVVNINSLGGSVDTGLAIHDLLKENPAKVTTKIQGMSASSATIIFQAGDEREISANAMMLIHRAWTLGIGNANDFEALAKDLKKTDGVISNIYAKRGGKEQDFYLNLMNENNGDGKWLDADEAVQFGLVDKSVEPAFKKVAMDKSAFEQLGLPVPENLTREPEPEPEKEFDGQLTYKIGLEVEGLEELKALLKESELKETAEDQENEVDLDEEIKDRDEKMSDGPEEAKNSKTHNREASSSRERTLSLLKSKL